MRTEIIHSPQARWMARRIQAQPAEFKMDGPAELRPAELRPAELPAELAPQNWPRRIDGPAESSPAYLRSAQILTFLPKVQTWDGICLQSFRNASIKCLCAIWIA